MEVAKLKALRLSLHPATACLVSTCGHIEHILPSAQPYCAPSLGQGQVESLPES